MKKGKSIVGVNALISHTIFNYIYTYWFNMSQIKK